MYTNKRDERKSDNKVNVVKRLLVLFVITMSLMFAGGQSTPTAQAGRFCELVCGEPFIDPNDGQCKQICCPQPEECKMPCEERLCK
jgi:hypothetical protein